ncbi:MAG TPA: hypothetical protein VFV38_00940 [Ktedonobacteraceae bacterium]|nr:hypothetical protein [Ktedonobacteraceae bacterium]
MPRPHEALQACLDDVSRCLDVVTSRARLPRKRDTAALWRACERLKALLPLLETLPEQHEYLLRMQIQNLPDQITRLEQEAYLLFQEAKQQTKARLMSALLLGGLAIAVCSLLMCLVVLSVLVVTDSDLLLPATMLCLIALVSMVQAGFLGYWKSEDHHKPSAMRILLEQQHAVECQGQVLMQHLIDVQGELQSRAAGASSW